ncbi:MAG: hypothetical protein HKP38_00610 [Croceitalea sp.]|nr:hypothetical protein [Croceitalea sp.]
MRKQFFMVLTIPILLFASCEVEKLDEETFHAIDAKAKSTPTRQNMADCIVTETRLIAGQHTEVGNLKVAINGSFYEITLNITAPGYCLTETHIAVASSYEFLPQSKSGNPKVGNFEFSKSHDCSTNYTYRIPVSKGSVIAVHGVVENASRPSETIWAQGCDFTGKSWAMYFHFDKNNIPG